MIIDIAFVIMFIIFPVFVIAVMEASGLSVFRVTIPSFVIINMFAFAYIGIIPLYFGWDEYRFNSGVQDRLIMLKVFYYACLSISGLLLGFIFTKKIVGFGNLKPINLKLRILKQNEFRVIVFLLFLSLIILYIYISKLSRVALIVAFIDGIDQSAVARSMMGNDFAGKYHWYKLMMRDLLYFTTFTLYAAYLINRKRCLYFYLSIAFLGSAFSSLMATEKAPFVWFLIGMFLTYLLVKKIGKINVVFVLKLLFSILIPLILFYIYFMGSSSILEALKSVFSRAFTGQIQPAYHYLEFFPKHHAFLLGKSFPNPGGLFPYKPYRLTVEIMNWRFPDLAEKGIVGSMPTAFWGELYANFGTLGVVTGSFLLGIVVYTTSYLVSSLENTPIKIGLLVWLLLHYKTVATTGISAFIVDFYGVGMFVIVIIAINIGNRGKVKYLRKRRII